ncbi:MAG: hypothetical protein E7474_04325 [Ruminococcaceae bacterium]|nr:hypothetical protein [Oscillospiraceae bacterium]
MAKRQTNEQRELEKKSAAILGHHVSAEKGAALLAYTALACLVPMALGLRLWQDIPLVVETGLTGPNGQDDSLPRWGLVFLLPGIFLLLDLINHAQLRRFQRAETVPPRYTRLMGRWGFPLVELPLCAWAIPSGAGRPELTGALLPLWLAGLALMIAGGCLLDCRRGDRFTLDWLPGMDDPASWHAVHRLAGFSLLTGGVLLLFAAALAPAFPLVAALLLLSMGTPVLYALLRRRGQG